MSNPELPSDFLTMRTLQYERVSAATNRILLDNLNGRNTTVFFSREDGEPTQALLVDSEVLAMLMGAEQAIVREIWEHTSLKSPFEDA